MMRHVSQRSLHRKTFDVGDERMSGVSIFPFFDDRGVVHRYMMVARGSAKIVMMPRERLDLHLPLVLGKRRIAQTWSGLADTDSAAAGEAATLWHFDPWWVLGEERYHGHPAVSVLQGTNLPGHLPHVDGLWFRRDLSRVTRYCRTKGGEPVIKKYSERLVADLPRFHAAANGAESAHTNRLSGWVLRPFWLETSRTG